MTEGAAARGPESPSAASRSLFRSNADADVRQGLARRYPRSVWYAVFSAFIVIHYLLFGFVHNYVDLRVCIGYSPDPLFRFIPHDLRWEIVTKRVYELMIFVGAAAVITQAVRGTHAPALRWTLALCFHTSMRMLTLLMIPLCRPTVIPGGPPPLTEPATLDLHFFEVPWRIYAVNDLVYSGHTSLFLMLIYATATWPKAARIGVGIFAVFMAYGLIATRDHYTIDILMAIPFSYFADRMARGILRWRRGG